MATHGKSGFNPFKSKHGCSAAVSGADAGVWFHRKTKDGRTDISIPQRALGRCFVPCRNISGIFFRSAWKYRKRAFRYVLLDMGHLIENLYLSLCDDECRQMGTTAVSRCNGAGCRMLRDRRLVRYRSTQSSFSERRQLPALFGGGGPDKRCTNIGLSVQVSGGILLKPDT